MSNNAIQKSNLKRKERIVLSKRTGRYNRYMRVPLSLLKAVPRRGMYVFAFTFHDGMCSLIDGITLDTTVEQLKERIAQVDGLPAWQQRIISLGRRLEAERSLAFYGIGAGAMVNVAFAL